MDEIVVIELFGEEFRFKPDDQVENPQQVARFLKSYLSQAEQTFQQQPSGRNKMAILLLAAMNISKDFQELKQQHAELEKTVQNKLSSLNEKIDKGMI